MRADRLGDPARPAGHGLLRRDRARARHDRARRPAPAELQRAHPAQPASYRPRRPTATCLPCKGRKRSASRSSRAIPTKPVDHEDNVVLKEWDDPGRPEPEPGDTRGFDDHLRVQCRRHPAHHRRRDSRPAADAQRRCVLRGEQVQAHNWSSSPAGCRTTIATGTVDGQPATAVLTRRGRGRSRGPTSCSTGRAPR